ARIVTGALIEATVDAEIYNIMIDAEYRRRGLAQMLFDNFLNTCRNRRVVNVWLEVRESNTPAKRFYEKNGFEHVHTRRNFYRDPQEHALLMRMILAPAATLHDPRSRFRVGLPPDALHNGARCKADAITCA